MVRKSGSFRVRRNVTKSRHQWYPSTPVEERLDTSSERIPGLYYPPLKYFLIQSRSWFLRQPISQQRKWAHVSEHS